MFDVNLQNINWKENEQKKTTKNGINLKNAFTQ